MYSLCGKGIKEEEEDGSECVRRMSLEGLYIKGLKRGVNGVIKLNM